MSCLNKVTKLMVTAVFVSLTMVKGYAAEKLNWQFKALTAGKASLTSTGFFEQKKPGDTKFFIGISDADPACL